jgi:hypothetical protein
MARPYVNYPFSTDGVELAVKDATALPVNVRGYVFAGSDGTNTRFVNVDSLGRVLVHGAGTAGAPAGGVVSVQGVSGGQTLPVSGTVTGNQGTPGSHANRWMVGISDGSTFISPSTDRTTAAAPFSVRLSDGSAFYLSPSASQLPGSLVGGRLDTNTGAWLGSTAPTVGQKNMAASLPVTIASDQSAVPVSGTITANVGTTNGLALDATLTGGTQKAINRGGAKGATAAADVTSTAEGADHQALDVQIYHGGTVINPTAIRTLTSSDVVTAAQGTAAALAGYWPVRVTDGTNTMPTGDSVARGLFHKITDGTNTAAVKAASTAAVAADSALVVAISPNNVVPVSGAVASQVDGHSASIGSTGDADTSNTVIGRLKKLVSLIAGGLPSTLIGGRLDTNIGTWLGSTSPTVGQKVMSASIPVTFATDQPAIAVTTSPISSTPTLSFGDIALAAITTAALRRTAYTEQSVNFTGSVASSSALDTAAGTGARTLRIFYVDATGVTAGFEDVALNGTANVNLVTATKCFIEKIEVLTVGSTGSNAGILTLRSGLAGTGTVIGTIAATDNRTHWAHHYVVSGKTCNVTGILIGSNVTNTVGSCIGLLRSQVLPVANQVEKQVSDGITVAGLDSSVFRSYGSQIQVTGPARITLYVTTATGSAFNYRGSFDAYDN